MNAAKKAVYSNRAVQNLPDALKNKWFKKLENEQWKLSSDVVGSVDLRLVNLIESADTKKYQNIDVIFCRNLLIYFDDTSRRIAAENLFEAMRPGGYICLGHSESMSRISSLFKVCKYNSAIVYQKPGV